MNEIQVRVSSFTVEKTNTFKFTQKVFYDEALVGITVPLFIMTLHQSLLTFEAQ